MRRHLRQGRPNRRRGFSVAGPLRNRRLLLPLLGVALAASGVLAPIESADLPIVFDRVAGASAVSAQNAVVDGHPSACRTDPVPWEVSPDLSECHLDMVPCPVEAVIVGPVIGEVFLESSRTYFDSHGIGLSTYPGFCELRILEVDDADAYQDCLNATGLAVVDDDADRVVNDEPETVDYCRLLQPAECPAGVRVNVDNCRSIERRGWSCDPGYALMNEFNKCYRRLSTFTLTVHPACGEGAPDFIAQSCADYAGADFSESLDCARDFPTVDPPDSDKALSRNSKAGVSSRYWCEFDSAYLNVACHGTSPPPGECGQSTAICLKRSTQTGGCNAIAGTIQCRALEMAYREVSVTALEVRRAGCQPCILLPFTPVSSDCPGDVLAEPLLGESDEELRVLAARADFSVNEDICVPLSDGSVSDACIEQSKTCADPAQGRLTWSSTHFSQHAVVNSPVILSVRDIPVEVRDGGYSFSRSADEIMPTRQMLPYPESGAGEFGDAMARFGIVDPDDASLDNLRELVGIYGECMFKRAPQFRLRVRELWPDSPDDLAAIERHFGSSSLEWWRALDPTTEWEARTLERGLEYWPELSADEQRERIDRLTQEIDCNFDLPVWCRWTPSRTGYFEIEASAAWIADRWVRTSRRVISRSTERRINSYLSDPVNRSALEDQMFEWGATTPDLLGQMAYDLGLQRDRSALRPLSEVTSELIFAGSESRLSCGGTDIRVYCSSDTVTGNYTETDPIGIMVHEVRVATRAPNG